MPGGGGAVCGVGQHGSMQAPRGMEGREEGGRSSSATDKLLLLPLVAPVVAVAQPSHGIDIRQCAVGHVSPGGYAIQCDACSESTPPMADNSACGCRAGFRVNSTEPLSCVQCDSALTFTARVNRNMVCQQCSPYSYATEDFSSCVCGGGYYAAKVSADGSKCACGLVGKGKGGIAHHATAVASHGLCHQPVKNPDKLCCLHCAVVDTPQTLSAVCRALPAPTSPLPATRTSLPVWHVPRAQSQAAPRSSVVSSVGFCNGLAGTCDKLAVACGRSLNNSSAAPLTAEA